MAARKAATHAQPARLNAGFTLVEIAVVMVLISLIVGALLPLLTAQTANSRIVATRAHQESIRAALISYVGQHGYLPCPADGWTKADDANYGHEARTSANQLPAGSCDLLSSGHTPTNSQTYNPSGNAAIPKVTIFRGVVPWLDLGLPEDAVNDAWNQRITYVVSDLGVTGYASREAVSGLLGALTVCRDFASGAGPVAPPIGSGSNACTTRSTATPLIGAQSPAVALISHGENGYGAFVPASGSVKPYASQASAMEKANIDLGQNVLVQSGYSQDFDDLVLWLTPADLTGPLIASGSLPSVQALTSRKFEQAKAVILANMIAQSESVLDPTSCTTANSYALSQPLGWSPGGSATCPALCTHSVSNVPLSQAALPAGLTPPVMTLVAQSSWSFSFDGPIDAVYGASDAGTGMSNRDSTKASLSGYDPWGNPLLFTLLNVSSAISNGNPGVQVTFTASDPSAPATPYAFLIYSVGPDGLAGTADDTSIGVTNNELKATLMSLGGLAPRDYSTPQTCTPPPKSP